MSANEWVGLVLAGLSIAGILFTSLRWLIRVEFRTELQKEVRCIVQEELKIVNHELTNNGGSSTKDKIDYIFKHFKDKEHGAEG